MTTLFKKLKINEMLTLRQTAQISGGIITPYSDIGSYPKTKNENAILKAGDKIVIKEKIENHGKYNWPALLAVTEKNNKQFYILSPDISRFFI